MDKKKSVDPNIKECTNCGTSGASLTCGACKAAHYCSKACQKQHWKNGHKGTCIAPEKRRPHKKEKPDVPADVSLAAADNQAGESAEACTICLELLSDATLCTLPCEHEFHQDCVEALRKLGVLQACPLCRADLPDGPEKLFEEAIRMYVPLIRIVDKGNSTWRTLSVSENKIATEVKVMLTTAAKQGHADAQVNLGFMYSRGGGVAQDHKEASRWTTKAAYQGHAMAQYNLAIAHFNGTGVLQDDKEAVCWSRKSADQGFAGAQNGLGVMYRKGTGVAQDDEEAVCWFRKAANQGHAQAQFHLGASYERGEGVVQDHKEAVCWYQKAADQDNTNGQNNLGIMYKEGKGVAQDHKEAVRWYRKAAAQGVAEAQCNLGVMYRKGLGVSQDDKEAVRWFQKAVDQGHANAQRALADMSQDSQVSGSHGALSPTSSNAPSVWQRIFAGLVTWLVSSLVAVVVWSRTKAPRRR